MAAIQKGNIEAAMIVVSIIPILLVYPLVLKYFTKGVTVGAVKG
jgi:putative aldouronate transport system permease protein